MIISNITLMEKESGKGERRAEEAAISQLKQDAGVEGDDAERILANIAAGEPINTAEDREIVGHIDLKLKQARETERADRDKRNREHINQQKNVGVADTSARAEAIRNKLRERAAAQGKKSKEELVAETAGLYAGKPPGGFFAAFKRWLGGR